MTDIDYPPSPSHAKTMPIQASSATPRQHTKPTIDTGGNEKMYMRGEETGYPYADEKAYPDADDKAYRNANDKISEEKTSEEKVPTGSTKGSSETAVASPAAEPSTDKPRKRRGFLAKLTGKGKDKDESEGADEEDDSKSKKPKQKFTFWGQLRATLFGSWINILLIAAPVGIAVNYAKINPGAIFAINFIAIIPLAAMLSYATEEIALRVGETLGGLLNATFGNAVELIVSIIALTKKEVLVVKTSLIGSMLSNLLLVMGMCFFFGGIHRLEQNFNVVVAQTAASLLALAVGSLIIPTAFHSWSGGKCPSLCYKNLILTNHNSW